MDTGRRARHAVRIERLAIGAFIVVAGVFVAFRLLGIAPWDMPSFDIWAYWLTRDGPGYETARVGATGAYLYSPAFAQAIVPLTALPWPVFAGVWTAGVAALLLWLTGPWAIVLLALPPIAMSVVLGQLELAYAAVAVVGLRWPAVWTLPLLTKVTPGVGLIWFVVRREWRPLAIALGTTTAVAVVSLILDPAAWRAWVDLLLHADAPPLGGMLWFVPISPWIRLPVAAALVAWGGRTDRHWTIPVAMFTALPVIWVNSPTILVALLPLAATGAATPAAAWLRSHRVAEVASAATTGGSPARAGGG